MQATDHSMVMEGVAVVTSTLYGICVQERAIREYLNGMMISQVSQIGEQKRGNRGLKFEWGR